MGLKDKVLSTYNSIKSGIKKEKEYIGIRTPDSFTYNINEVGLESLHPDLNKLCDRYK